MSYVPPHKRPENVAIRASSVPPPLHPKRKKNLENKNTKKIYADDYISRWFIVGSDSEDDNFQLGNVSSEWWREMEDKSFLTLRKGDFKKLEIPWLWVVEKVKDDLILGFDRAKKTLPRFGSDDVKIRLVAQFGKVVFHGLSSSETLRDGSATKSTLQTLKKSFHTNVPKSYKENIEDVVVHNMGVCFEETKELYSVQVLDNSRPDVTICCKCMVEHERLTFYKAELNPLKHLVLNVSSLHQDLDMRLIVNSKETLTNLSKNEIKNLKELTDAAMINPNVKGGLKWPLGKSSCADRYRVCGVRHTVTTTYRNSTLKVQVREADRYDFRTGSGETAREVNLKLRDLSSKLLKEEDLDKGICCRQAERLSESCVGLLFESNVV